MTNASLHFRLYHVRGVSGGWARGAIAHPVFGRIEGGGVAAAVRHITTCPPSFRYPLTPLLYYYTISCAFLSDYIVIRLIHSVFGFMATMLLLRPF